MKSPHARQAVRRIWETSEGAVNRVLFREAAPGALVRYGVTLLAISLASAVIGLAQAHQHHDLLALTYVLVVVLLAVAFGTGPAIVGALLACLEYDFFFVQPYGTLAVADLADVVSLLSLLLAGMIVSGLVGAVRRRQQRTALLYTLTRAIAGATDPVPLARTLASETLRVFAPDGVRACGVFAPELGVRAVAGVSAAARALVEREDGPVLAAEDGHLVVFSLPLRPGQEALGALRVAGSREAERRLHALDPFAPAGGHALLFQLFRDHIALALEREALRREAIHAEALRESDQLKTALLGSVSHDLRTPLAAIQAAASSLLDPKLSWSETERAEFLDSIVTSAQRLTRLVRNLLDLSRLEAGVAAPEWQWYPLEDVVNAVLDRLELAGQTRGRKLAVALPSDLPLLFIDPGQMEQVMTNLLENALRYSPPESDVRIGARLVPAEGDGANGHAGRAVEFWVADTGVGIPAANLERIFERFYRVAAHLPWEPEGRPATGTGLGLAICAAIVRAHGGRIWAESQSGAGTTVFVRLPLLAERPEGHLPDLPGLPDDDEWGEVDGREEQAPADTTGDRKDAL